MTDDSQHLLEEVEEECPNDVVAPPPNTLAAILRETFCLCSEMQRKKSHASVSVARYFG